MASFFARFVPACAAALALLPIPSCSPSNEPGDGSAGGSDPGGTAGVTSAGTAGTPSLGGSSGAGTSGASSGGVSGTGPSGGTAGGGAGGTVAGSAGSSAGTSGTAGVGGGASGAGGDGGSDAGSAGSSSGAGGAAGSGGGTATGFLVEDFESGTVGQQPSGWDNFISYQRNGPNPNGETLALVDDTRAHSGTKSVHFHGGANPTMITRALPANTNRLYVRAWVYMTRQLGMNPGANHETLIGIRATPGDANNEVRFGEIKGVIGTNEVPSDNISPKMDRWGMGPVVPANTWACIEVAFLGDLPTHELRAWHDGVLVHEITSSGDDQWQNGPLSRMDWMTGKFTEVIVGWQSFSSADLDLWVDDLILSNDPIGCN